METLSPELPNKSSIDNNTITVTVVKSCELSREKRSCLFFETRFFKWRLMVWIINAVVECTTRKTFRSSLRSCSNNYTVVVTGIHLGNSRLFWQWVNCVFLLKDRLCWKYVIFTGRFYSVLFFLFISFYRWVPITQKKDCDIPLHMT